MNKQNLDNEEDRIIKKVEKRIKKKKLKMKVSGAGVKRLQKIIKDKNWVSFVIPAKAGISVIE